MTETIDGLTVHGARELRGGAVDSFNDHRITMALAVAASGARGEVIINGSDSVEKSYPGFWDDFSKLGGLVYER